MSPETFDRSINRPVNRFAGSDDLQTVPVADEPAVLGPRALPSTSPRGRTLPEGAFILPGDMDRIAAAVSDLKISQNAHASVPITVRIHIHHEYPKHVSYGAKTAVVNNQQQEESFLKDGTLPLAAATPLSGFPTKATAGDDAAKQDQALSGVQSLIDALAASRTENERLRAEVEKLGGEGTVLPSALPSGDDLDANDAENQAAIATAGRPVIETKHYSDGSSATGVAPLPGQSPAQQDALRSKNKFGASGSDSNTIPSTNDFTPSASAPLPVSVPLTAIGDVQIPAFVAPAGYSSPLTPQQAKLAQWADQAAPRQPKNEPGVYLTPEDQGAVTSTGKAIEPSNNPFASPAALATPPAAKVVSVAPQSDAQPTTDTDEAITE